MLKERIKEQRQKLKITQEELAKYIGVSQQTVGSWEVGRTEPNSKTLHKLSEIFHCTVEYLLGITSHSRMDYGNYFEDEREFREWCDWYCNKVIEVLSDKYGPDFSEVAQIKNAVQNNELLPSEKRHIAEEMVKKHKQLFPNGSLEMPEDAYSDPLKDLPKTYLPIDAVKQLVSPEDAVFFDSFTKIPIVGRIPAGAPQIAEEFYEGYENIPSSWLNGDPHNFFILKVEGDSMEGAKIFDGDLALIKKCPTCENGQICAIGITGETPDLYATLKRVYSLDSEYLELVPENSKYPRRKVKRSEVNIFGTLKMIHRKY